MNMTKTKKIILTGIAFLVLLAAVAGVLLWENQQKKKEELLFPKDGLEASLKLSGKGYTVQIEDNASALQSLLGDAGEMYQISFFGTLDSYIEVYDSESKESMQAQIFCFEHNSDAQTLYDAMLSNWQYDKEQGELRVKDNVVYMGYAAALDALEN